MSFFHVILRGLLRRPVRTGLTLLGIAIGIAAVVALVGMSRGFEKSWVVGMKARGTDIVVSSMGTSLMPKPFSDEGVKKVAALPGVETCVTLLVDMMSIESADMMLISSRQWGGFNWDNLKLLAGRLPESGQEEVVLLGSTAAEMLGKKPGDPLQLDTHELKVAGIFDGGAWVENGSIILSLELYQRLTGNEGKINVIDVRLKPGMDQAARDELCRQINALVPEGKAIAADEHIGQSQSYKMIRAISWGTSLLAVLVGILGVMNTMLMTVFERTQEIAILLAIGWKRSRVVRMILMESAMLGFTGGLVGVALGWVGVKLLETSPQVRGMLEPDLSLSLMVSAVAIAVGVGVVSGLYPAWRASRLPPGLALAG